MFFEKYCDKFHNSYRTRKALVIFGIFSSYCQFVAGTYLFIIYLNFSEIVLVQVSFAVPVVVASFCYCQDDPIVENFNLQILHSHICGRSLKIYFCSLKLCFRTGRSSPYNFPFVNLVSSKLKQISLKISWINEGKRTSYNAARFLSASPSCNQKQSLPDFSQNMCSWKFCKILRKTPVSETLF